ncbi:MAG: glycosyltransferase [Bacteroidaceae bacterium]
MTYSPIILFTYNRPEHTRRIITSLLQNSEAAKSELFIYSDAPKDASIQEAVEQVRTYIHSIKGFAQVNIVERKENWGLARNVIDGVTTIVNRFERVIVLEDDLVVAPYFLKFMNDALEMYKDEPRVGHIQACDFTQDNTLPDTFLIKWTGSWGWATWNRAWKLFNPDGKALLKELKDRRLTKTFDFNSTYGFTRMLKRQIAGKNNSWAIRWNASLFLHGVLSLNTGKSLVQNDGFDGSGTNCGGGSLYASNLWLEQLSVEKAETMTENLIARRAMQRYYHRTNCFMAKAIRRIKRTLKGDFGA